jgi:hypothetical protein
MPNRFPDSFDATDNRLRPLAEYTDRLPSRRRRKKLNRATLWRWALRGARGGRVRLETWVIGSGRFTSDAAVAAFMKRLAEHREACAATPAAPAIDPQHLGAIRERFGVNP